MHRGEPTVETRDDRTDIGAGDASGSPQSLRLAARLRGAMAAMARDRGEPADDAAGLEVVAALLWSRFLRFDAVDPRWPDRDRLVLSSGRFLPLLRAVLRLTGHDDVGDACVHGQHPAIETAIGPPGQGFATAVGMAMAERALAARFGRTLVDHRTWVLACETDLAAGVSLEAAALAGQMALDKLVVLFDAGPSDQDQAGAPGPDTMTRFAACGWAVRRVDAGDADAVAAAIAGAMRVRRPSLIACQLADAPTSRPSGDDADGDEGWAACGRRGGSVRRGWLRRLARHRLQPEFERMVAARLPTDWQPAWRTGAAAMEPGRSTLESGSRGLALLCGLLPEMMTLHSRPGTAIVGHLQEAGPSAAPPRRPARHLACGVQEHGMAALLNGLSLHGGSRPVLGASFVSIDRMRPALRLAALMAQPVIYLLTDDGLAPGEDGAGWQPVEQLASLRAMPDVSVFRPADTAETVACWELALRHDTGPSLIALCPRAPGAGMLSTVPDASRGCTRGGYVLAEPAAPREVTLIGTGPEVGVALAARALLETHGIAAAVVSLPCWELFAAQPASYRESILGEALRVGIETASGFGWERWLGPDGIFVGIDGFGTAASTDTLYRRFGITPDSVATRVVRRLGLHRHSRV